MSDTLVRAECDHCGCDTFVIYYDPKAQGYHAECDGCGNVFGGIR